MMSEIEAGEVTICIDSIRCNINQLLKKRVVRGEDLSQSINGKHPIEIYGLDSLHALSDVLHHELASR